MPTHAYYGSCRVSKRPPTWRSRNERRNGTDSWTPDKDSRSERGDSKDGRDRQDNHRDRTGEREDSRNGRNRRDRRGEREDTRDEREDSVHNNYGRVNNNYNINIRSFGDNDRSRHWNGNVLRDRNFNTYVRNRPRRDRFDNRRYSPALSSRQSSRRTSFSSRTRSWVTSDSNTNSFSDRPVDSIETPRGGEDTDETGRRERDDGDDEYYGARQAYRDISRGDVVQGRMRPTDRVCDESELRLGAIISTAIHNQAREDTVAIDEFNKSLSGFGIVYSKYRKLIVVEEWAQHVVCIPLYTYNGRGLAGREALACEYFDVRDVGDPDPESGDTFCTLMAVRDREWPMENTFIEGRTVAKVTEKITFYRTNKCSIEGRIDQESLSTLIPPYLRSSTNPLAKFLSRSQSNSPADSPTDDAASEKEEGEI
ncbi:uncharacterized protein NECHADRAFT_77591 [Fusarium vanettenii 77-13-4]|uniref:DUF6590 domain-containing protein n=1 Tax=Fusarium vanettenii (strain ATCC MYA-4622 / CBS 123669 / FGSC 9596 / NRRL 45880 / 77-13-4) TaxID=660122 RepID=C7YLN0_FUSV7|nr:uncharacterized protein NECHADRAFT_77591 [Fusarium vanettenii 77-13-4]EEU46808.1 hypothetical protein NECHADRAFT_77591 [Fusarium vanettenii 77-13-4]